MNTKEQRVSEEMSFDLRIVEARIRKGELDPKEYEAFLKKLPNEEANAEYIEVYEEPKPEEPTPHSSDLTFTSA